MTQIIKYIAVNTANNEPLFESDSYKFLLKFVHKVMTKHPEKGEIKIYKRIITVEENEMIED